MIYRVYVGTFADHIYLLEANSSTGSVQIKNQFPAQKPAYLVPSKDRKFLFVALHLESFDGQYGGAVASYSISSDGNLSPLSTIATGGRAPCHLTVDEESKRLYVANYQDGKLSCIEINKGMLSEPLIVDYLEPVQSAHPRQEGPHAHCTVISPDGERLYVVDLGADCVRVYRIKEGGLPVAPSLETKILTDPQDGPRHMVFSKNGKFAWVACELSNKVHAFSMSGTPERIGSYDTLNGYEGENYVGAIRLSRSGKSLAVTNRGQDSVCMFRILEGGSLQFLKNTKTYGKHPRDIEFTPEGSFLASANLESNNITVFSVYEGNSNPLYYMDVSFSIPSPCNLVFL